VRRAPRRAWLPGPAPETAAHGRLASCRPNDLGEFRKWFRQALLGQPAAFVGLYPILDRVNVEVAVPRVAVPTRVRRRRKRPDAARGRGGACTGCGVAAGAFRSLGERTVLAYEFSLVDARSAPVSVRRWQARAKPIVTTNQHDSRELARVMMVLQLDPHPLHPGERGDRPGSPRGDGRRGAGTRRRGPGRRRPGLSGPPTCPLSCPAASGRSPSPGPWSSGRSPSATDGRSQPIIGRLLHTATGCVVSFA